MKPYLKCLVIAGLLMSFQLQAQDGEKSYTVDALNKELTNKEVDKSIPVVTDEEIRKRVESLSHQVPMKYNRLVKSHIEAYIKRRRKSTETIIGRSAIYFPIFENALIRHGIPTDLKYLAIVESALDPTANSPVGARGLWQFMRGTGRQYNLRITKYVDERSDPHMSSDAAARYLQDLFERYNDWSLAIAAYNCGPGRVNKAIAKANSKDYWTIMRYLPKETRNYVPAFIAAAYSSNYYHLHNLYPTFPEYDLQVTEKVRVFRKMTLREIAKASDTDYETVKFLNPSYLQNFIPASKTGYLVILPMAKMTAFREYAPDSKPMYFASSSMTEGNAKLTSLYKASEPTVEYEKVKKIYNVKRGDNLGKIAQKHSVTVRDIRSWNNLKTSLLQINQKLVVYELRPKETETAPVLVSNEEAMTAAPQRQADVYEASTTARQSTQVKKSGVTTSIFYDVRRGDTLWKISRRYENITVSDLMTWNGIKNHNDLRPGMQLKIFVR